MGEIADMILDGTLCEGCGEVFDDGDAPGHPRRCGSCRPSKAPQSPPKPFPCPTCGKRFGCKGALRQHKRDAHPKAS